ncbi:MAG: DUF1013 domain-containing protein [Alphaproteobacteria bacterium]|nr:DUF1013 domain-containing protein [Alphaproteobacteria bacterium]
MARPLMPKATAVWLVENTPLTFEQIAEFCGLHSLEVQAIADGEVATGMQGLDPVVNGQLTKEELERCIADPAARLNMASSDIPQPVARPRGPRYTPIAKRQDKPDAIAWLIKHYPMLTDAQISRLIGTTKPTIAAVRDRSHWNSPNIRARNPVAMELCSQGDIDAAVGKIQAKAAAAEKAKKRAAEKAKAAAEAAAAAAAAAEADAAAAAAAPEAAAGAAPEQPEQPAETAAAEPSTESTPPAEAAEPPAPDEDKQVSGQSNAENPNPQTKEPTAA